MRNLTLQQNMLRAGLCALGNKYRFSWADIEHEIFGIRRVAIAATTADDAPSGYDYPEDLNYFSQVARNLRREEIRNG